MDYDLIKLKINEKKLLLTDLDNQYLNLTGLMREFQNIFIFGPPIFVTSSVTSV